MKKGLDLIFDYMKEIFQGFEIVKKPYSSKITLKIQYSPNKSHEEFVVEDSLFLEQLWWREPNSFIDYFEYVIVLEKRFYT